MVVSTELSADFVAQQISKGIQVELHRKILEEVKKVADKIIEEVATEIAQSIKSNLVAYKQFGSMGSNQIILHMMIDGVEKAKF